MSKAKIVGKNQIGPAVSCIDVNHEGSLLFGAYASFHVAIYNVVTGDLIQAHETVGPVTGVELCKGPVQNRFVCCSRNIVSGDSHTIDICEREANEMTNGTVSVTTISIPMGLHHATGVHWGPFDETIISIHETELCIWSAFNGDLLDQFQAHDSPIKCIEFNSSRTLAITASRDMTAKLWRITSAEGSGATLGSKWELVSTIKSNRPLNCCSIPPFFTKNDLEDMVEPKTIVNYAGEEVKMSERVPRAHVLVAGGLQASEVTTTGSGHNFEVQLFNMALQKKLAELDLQSIGPINCIKYLPNGMGFVTGGEDSAVRICHLDPDYFTMFT